MEELTAFILAGLALAGSPGPATLSLAATGAAFGSRGGVSYMIGLGLGMIPVMVLTASGVAAMLLALPGIGLGLTLGAALYFAYLAFRIATAPPQSATTGADHRPPTFAAGILLALVNPKGYAAMTALFAGFVLVPASAFQDAALKIAILTGIIFAVNAAWLLIGVPLTPLLRAPRTNRIINVTFAALLLLSVAAALLS